MIQMQGCFECTNCAHEVALFIQGSAQIDCGTRKHTLGCQNTYMSEYVKEYTRHSDILGNTL